METKKFASLLEDDSLSFSGRDAVPYIPSASRPQSPSPSGRFSLRRSFHSTRSASVSPEPASQISCVTRATAKDDCETHRFVVWAATKRNACERMTDAERLECPLLRCTHRFQDHESMLRHLVVCDYLPSCEYWCYDHMRIERFDDSRCKKCLGSPSRRRKMLFKARNFFTALGHNKGKDQAMGPFSPTPSFVSAASPASCDGSCDAMDLDCDLVSRSGSNGSNGRNARNASSSSGHSRCSRNCSSYRGRACDPLSAGSSSSSSSSLPPPPRYEDISSRAHAELPSTEIVEIDSRELNSLPQPAMPRLARGPAPTVALTSAPTSAPTSASVPPYASAATTILYSPIPRAASRASPVAGPPHNVTGEAVHGVSATIAVPSSLPNITPLLAPTPPPASVPSSLPAPLPVTPISAPMSGPIAPPSINPQALLLPELDSNTTSSQDFMDWQAIEHTMPNMDSVLGGASTNPFPFLDFQGREGLSFGEPTRPLVPLNTQSLHMLNQAPALRQPTPPPRPSRPVPSAPRSKNLSPSSSVRSTTSTTSTASTATTMTTASTSTMASGISNFTDISVVTDFAQPDIISPVSDASQEGSGNPWSTGIETCLTSPTGDFSDLFADDLFTANQGMCDGSVPVSGGFVPTEPAVADGSDATTMVANMVGDDFLFSFDGSIAMAPADKPVGNNIHADLNACLDGNLGGALSAGLTAGLEADDSGANDVDPGLLDLLQPEGDCSEAKAMVTSAWDLLLTHIMTSLDKLRNIDSTLNSLAAFLLNTSPGIIVSMGIQALQALVRGNSSVSPSSTLCLLHLVYALSFVTHGSMLSSRSDALFLRSVAYAQNFVSPQREQFLEVASVIWKPRDLSAAELDQCIKELATNPVPVDAWIVKRGGQDLVLDTARDFLDDLEISAILGPSVTAFEVQNSALFNAHIHHQREAGTDSDFISSVERALNSLVHEFPGDTNLTSRFEAIRRLASIGTMRSVRHLELQLLRGGRMSLGPSSMFFDTYTSRARSLCDPIYARLEPIASQRAKYYENSIQFISSIFGELEKGRARKDPEGGSALLDGVFSGFTADRGGDTEPLPAANADVDTIAKHPMPASSVSTSALALGPASAPASASTTPATAETSKSEATTPEEQLAAPKVEVESVECCEECGYRPKGDPQWFRGSMAKHKKTKHSVEVIYKCPYPNCQSQYRNRPDNLRQHQIEKNHWVGDEAVTKKARRHQSDAGDKEDEAVRRPSKRKKISG